MKTFDHIVLTNLGEVIEAGKDGYELVSVVVLDNYISYFLKKEIIKG